MLFKDASSVFIRDGIDHLYDLGFQIHEAVDVLVDLIPERKIFHHPGFIGALVVPASLWCESEERGSSRAGGIEVRQAVNLPVDCLVRGECLGQILLRRQVLHDLNSSFSLLSRVRPS